MPQKKILLVDYGGWEAVPSIPHLFYKAGYPADIFCRKHSWISRTSYYKKRILAPDDMSAFIQRLRDVLTVSAYDWVICTDDIILREIKMLADDPLFAQILPVAQSVKNILGGKAGFSKMCQAHDISTPLFRIYTGERDIYNLAREVGFPLVLKVDESAGGSGVFLCREDIDIENHWTKLDTAQKNNLVVQKYIEGKNLGVEAIYKNSELVQYACSAVAKTLGGEFGVSTERKYSTGAPALITLVKKVGNALGAHGFCSMTIMHDGNEYYLIETDMRPQAWYPLAHLGGVDFTKGIQAFLSSDNYLVPYESLKEGKTVRHFPRELVGAVMNRDALGIGKWLCGAGGRWRVVPWHDPKLLFWTCFLGIRHYLRMIKNKTA